jgi:diguanylate cyclase (GGDEF)-like protein
MNIDEPTLTVVLGIASLIASGMFLTLTVFANRIAGMHLWAIGCLAVGMAMLLDGPRLIADWRLASMLFNILFGCGQASILAGTMQFCGQAHARRTLGWLVVSGVALTTFFTFAVADSSSRIAALSAYQVFMNVWTALILWRYPDPLARRVFRFASVVAWVQASAAFAQGAIISLSSVEITYAAPQLPIANIISWGGAMINILLGNWTLFLLVMLRLVADLKVAADLDLLTGLPNRRGLRRHIDQVLHRLVDGRGTVAVALLDIDYFKAINDQFGHQMGDRVLVAMGEVLLEIAAVSPCRWGGEEFCIVAEGKEPVAMVEMTEALRLRFRAKSAAVIGDGIERTVSVGIACSAPGAKVEMAQLMSAADSQLYLAKQGGRDRVFVTEVPDTVEDQFSI